MKAYTFIHSYICGIQVGIQAGHAIVDLMAESTYVPVVREWAEDHKTFVWLDGGDMSKVFNTLADSGMPCSAFQEPALGNQVTAASVVLTTEQVEACDEIRKVGLLKCVISEVNDIVSVLADSTPYLFPKEVWVVLELIINSRSKTL